MTCKANRNAHMCCLPLQICDFGLTRDFSDYSSSYVKKHDEPLPVKWMVGRRIHLYLETHSLINTFPCRPSNLYETKCTPPNQMYGALEFFSGRSFRLASHPTQGCSLIHSFTNALSTGTEWNSLSNHQTQCLYFLLSFRKPKTFFVTHIFSPRYQLMLECWLENAEIRPDFDQIVNQLQTQVCPKFYKVHSSVFVSIPSC